MKGASNALVVVSAKQVQDPTDGKRKEEIVESSTGKIILKKVRS